MQIARASQSQEGIKGLATSHLREIVPLGMVPVKQMFGKEQQMIGVVATLKVQPEKSAEFEKVFLDLAAKVKANEPGCLMYQLTKSRTDAGVYKVLEVYASEEALKAHGGTDYFKAAGAAMGPTMAGRPEIEYLDGVE